MNKQMELWSLAGAKREIDKRCANQSLNAEFIKMCNCDPSNKQKRHLNNIYGIVKAIDSGLTKGFIQNVESALRMRIIAISRIVSYMARNKIVAVDILKAVGVTLEQIGDEYTKQHHRTMLIVESIREHNLIWDAIIELAKEGKPYKSVNHDEIEKVEQKLDELEISVLISQSRAMKLIYTSEIESLEQRLQNLKQTDFFDSDFTLEDICFKIVYDVSRNCPSGEARSTLDRNAFVDIIWYLSKTAQNKIINLIVKSNKYMYEDEISEYRKRKKKDYKKEYMKRYNKKTLSTNEMRELVQLYKADGITQKEVAKQIGCCEKTVQNHWKTAS